MIPQFVFKFCTKEQQLLLPVKLQLNTQQYQC